MLCEKVKELPFDTNLEPTMCNLANGRITLKFNNVLLNCMVTSF